MRVIGGIHRSRKLLAPKDDSVTRPITDRVKQSLFDRLWALGAVQEPEEGVAEGAGGNVLDIFAGTGSLGIEALSRGSARCVLIERDRDARRLLEQNLAALDLAGRALVLGMDALAGGWVGVVPTEFRPVRVVFLDPPYALTDTPASAAGIAGLMATLAAAPGLMEPGGVLVLRTRDRATPPGGVPGWEGPASHAYGSMVLHFYHPDRRLPGTLPPARQQP
jgi:16S rRNA (guanine966-N2)-methyltransferase